MATITGDPPTLRLSLLEYSGLRQVDHACAVLRGAYIPEADVRAAWLVGAASVLGEDIASQLPGRAITVVCDELTAAGVTASGETVH